MKCFLSLVLTLALPLMGFAQDPTEKLMTVLEKMSARISALESKQTANDSQVKAFSDRLAALETKQINDDAAVRTQVWEVGNAKIPLTNSWGSASLPSAAASSWASSSPSSTCANGSCSSGNGRGLFFRRR